MIETRTTPGDLESLEPVQSEQQNLWTDRLVLFLRVMAGFSLLKGLFHWAHVCGIGTDDLFEYHSIAWQTATVFFAVIDLVAAVGLWLVAAWGAVVWLMSITSMLVVDMFFPQVFGGGFAGALLELGLLGLYLYLAVRAAQEHPP
jgi:uncharacterized membrane protein (DUF2068 family)